MQQEGCGSRVYNAAMRLSLADKRRRVRSVDHHMTARMNKAALLIANVISILDEASMKSHNKITDHNHPRRQISRNLPKRTSASVRTSCLSRL